MISQEPQANPPTVTRSNVVVSDGTFYLQLDFGACPGSLLRDAAETATLISPGVRDKN